MAMNNQTITEMKNSDVDTKDIPRFNILMCLPCMGHIHMSLTAMLLKWQREFPQNSINYYFTYKVAYIDRARNQCVEYFLKNKQYTHLMFIDADTIPPADGLLRMLYADADIVTGMTPMLQFDKEKDTFATMYNCFNREYDEAGELTRTVTPEPMTGVVEIERCGSSCILIRRKVFETLQKPFYQFKFNEDHTQHDQSEDIQFCDNAVAAGFKIMCDTNVICKHSKEVLL
jgi:GT2 family glycosyltransferase